MISNLLLVFIVFLFIALAGTIVMLIRNQLIYNYRQKALNEVYEKSQESIYKFNYDWKKYYDWYESKGEYNEMLFDLRKWKFNDFYNLEEINDPKITLLHGYRESIN